MWYPTLILVYTVENVHFKKRGLIYVTKASLIDSGI